MRRFKNILLFATGKANEKTALERAVALAKRNQAQLTVMGVPEELSSEIMTQITLMSSVEFRAFVIQERTEALEQFVAPARQENISIDVKVLFGTPFLEIIREVLRHQRDLVMMTAEGKGGLKEMLFGSTTMHLMRKCPCPVWVMKPTRRKHHARILAAVAPNPQDEVQTQLNRKIMQLATSLAEAEGSELHIVYVWLHFDKKILPASARTGASQLPKIMQELEQHHRSWLDELLGEFNLQNLPHQVHLLKGDAGKVIPALAQKKQVELVVMGTVSRTGVAGFFIGNTAERVLHQIDCAVLAVKPDGFVTPVKIEE